VSGEPWVRRGRGGYFRDEARPERAWEGPMGRGKAKIYKFRSNQPEYASKKRVSWKSRFVIDSKVRDTRGHVTFA
jgi:hypothetical protein